MFARSSIAGIDIALFRYDEGKSQIQPNADGTGCEDDPQHPHNGGVNIKIFRDSSADAGHHSVMALRTVKLPR